MATDQDYYIVSFETDQRAYRWRWEIRRHSKPMGVKITESGYQSKTAAEYVGKIALARFLQDLAKEERRSQ